MNRLSRNRLPNPIADNPFVPEAGAEPMPGYRLIRLRGRGGFATVWESTSPDGDLIAMKFMSSSNTSSTARELRSLQAIHRLIHPSLLQTRHVWSTSGQIMIAMDLAEASLLDLFLVYAEEFGQPVPVEKVLLYLYQAAEALDFLNARQHQYEGKTVGFQHADIKPNNILLIGDRAYLADYGLATPMMGPNTPCPRQGTLEYAAPEIFQGTLTDSSDQFGLAVTYYLLRSGVFPFPPPPKYPSKTYTRPAPDLGVAPEDERAILLRALSPMPQSRFPSCTEFIQQLLRVRGLEFQRSGNQQPMVRKLQRSTVIAYTKAP